MQVGTGNVRRGLVHAAVLGAVLTGCAQAAEDEARPGASTPAKASATVARSGGSIGAAGSACELPVAFDIADGWKAQAVDATPGGGRPGDRDGELSDDIADALLHQGPVTAACEVDAKPAGHIGYLRVWTGDPGDDDAHAVLEAFVAAEDGAGGATYRNVTAGDLDGVEVEYRYTSELLDETKQERALAVTTASGPVVLHLGGLDDDEHREMLPAFELAKRTLHTV